MSAEQAEGIAEAFGGATAEQLATKPDFAELRWRLRQTELRLEARIEAARSDVLLLRWMIGFALALLVAVFGKLFLH